MRRLLTLVAIVAASVSLSEVTSDDLHDVLLVPLLSEFNDLKNHLSTLDGDLVSKFGTNHNDLQAVRTAINDAKGSVDNAVSRLGTLNSNMSTLIDRVNAGNLTLGTINQGVTGLLSEIDDLVTATRAVRDACNSINQRVYDFKNAFDAYASTNLDSLAVLHADNQDFYNLVTDFYFLYSDTSGGIWTTLDTIDANLSSGLGDILQRLAVLASISESTANTYTNVVAIYEKLNSGILFDVGPTNFVDVYQAPTARVGLRWINYLNNTGIQTGTAASNWERAFIRVAPGGYFFSMLQELGDISSYTLNQRKSGVISALSDVWTTNYLGKVQQPLLVDLLAAAEAETNYLYSVQADMLRAITNSLANLNATNNQQSAQTEEAYSEMATSVSNQVSSLDMEENSDRFAADTAGFSPSLSSDALSAFDAVKSGLGDFATRAERKAQEGANGIRLGITLPQYAVGETTLLNGDEFLGAVGDPDGANGVHRFFTSVRSVFLAVWTVAYLGVAFALWRFLVSLWHRITSLFGETVDKSMMV